MRVNGQSYFGEDQLKSKVKGLLFLDYVRMLKSRKDVEWSGYLNPEDNSFLTQKINISEWYPFDAFERMVVAVIKEIANEDMKTVVLWGRQSIDNLVEDHRSLLCEGDPMESLMRFQVLRSSLFDFNPIEMEVLSGNYAKIRIDYGMCKIAEESAAYQAVGFFDRLLELSGASSINYRFLAKSWEGDPETVLELSWSEASPRKKVKGVLFIDYVRMLKGKKNVDWGEFLKPEDLPYLNKKIDDSEWYPFDTFERMGLAILKLVAGDDMKKVYSWGRLSVDDLLETHRSLICEDNPMESLVRFHVLRRSFFNFEAIYIEYISWDYAKLEVCYQMSKKAEEAATYQTLGFFERLLELSGATDIKHKFITKLWESDPTTILELSWK